MTRKERKTRFDVALDIVQKIHSDYCNDIDTTREQANEFNDVVQNMIRFSSVLQKEAEALKDIQ